MLNTFQEIFSNRELALLCWIIILFILVLFKKSIRLSFFKVVQMIFQKRFLTIYVILGIYLFFVFWLLKSIKIWEYSNIKDSIFWVLTVGLGLIFSVTKAKDTVHFQGVFLNSIKGIIIFEFLINFYSFSFMAEFIMLPVLVILGVTLAYSELDEKNNNVKKLLSNILSLVGLFFVFYSGYKTFIQFDDFFRLSTLKTFYLPIILTLLLIPFLYFLALYNIYESYFVRLNFMTTEKEKVKTAKRLIRHRAHININRLNHIIQNFEKRVFYDNTELKEYIRRVSKLKK